jgi:hypothetical protein
VPCHDPQPGYGSAAVEVEQGSGELSPMISLLIAEIVGAEQFASGVMQALRVGLSQKRIHGTFHDGKRSCGTVTTTSAGGLR